VTARSCPGVVMVVEDDVDIRESISEILEDNEYLPIQAGNGREAIIRLRAQSMKPCAILLDVMMPEMDGWQFRAVQREDPELNTIPVVVLTAHTHFEEIELGMQAAACLRKPIQLERLLATIDRLCRGSNVVKAYP
jgi:CheY-like chemotaxis protein